MITARPLDHGSDRYELRRQIDALTAEDIAGTPAAKGVYPTFNTRVFGEFFEGLWEAFEQLGIEVGLDDLTDVGAFLLSATNPQYRMLVVDRRLHLQAGFAVFLYYHMLAHVVAGDLDEPMSCVVESKQPGLRVGVETAEEIQSHRYADEEAYRYFEACVDIAGDENLAERLSSQGVPAQIASVCSALPGARKHLRDALQRLGKSRTHRLILFWLPAVRRLYHKYALLQELFAPNNPLVVWFREQAVALELRQFMPAPDAVRSAKQSR